MTTHAIVQFEPVDSWFFRESRPHGSVGANALNSVFPPPTRTLVGAIRSHIGACYFASHPQSSWDDLDKITPLKAVVGNAKELGSLQPRGVFLQEQQDSQTTYFLPAPTNICSKTEGDKTRYLAFELTSSLYETDIGKTYLVTLPEKTAQINDTRGFKPLENTWISTRVWEAILNADIASLSQQQANIRTTNDFISSEYRLGIELISTQRSIKEGQLYQTNHCRLKPNVSVIMPIEYNETELNQIAKHAFEHPVLLRVGGEARMAAVSVCQNTSSYLPKAPTKKLSQEVGDKKRFMLYFITKLAMQEKNWLPKDFNQIENGWQGVINDINMTIISACIGKAHREGGWNQLEHKPRAIENYLPAGSVFFVEVDESIDDKTIIDKLHGKTVENHPWGDGLMLVGRVFSN